MNDDVVLVYETDTKSGTPTLRVHGSGAPFEGAELGELEREVRSQYERLGRREGGEFTWRSRRFEVEVERGVNPRQPRLLLRLVSAGGVSGKAAGWPAGFFAAVRRLLEGRTDTPLPVHEKGTLLTVLDELQSLSAVDDDGLVGVLLAGYLATAEQHCRDCDPARAGVYVVALRGLSRCFPDPEGVVAQAHDRQQQGTAGPTPESRRAPWLRRFFGWLAGPGDATERTS